jgi:hypothetical protein
VGVRYWHEALGGRVTVIAEEEVDEGHFTRMRRKNYVAASVDDWRRDLSKELSANFPLGQVCGQFGLGALFDDVQRRLQAAAPPSLVPTQGGTS